MLANMLLNMKIFDK